MRSRSILSWCRSKCQTGGERKERKKDFQNGNPFLRATDGVRTRDPNLGKVVLYQLSHCRKPVIVPQNNNYYTTEKRDCQHFF